MQDGHPSSFIRMDHAALQLSGDHMITVYSWCIDTNMPEGFEAGVNRRPSSLRHQRCVRSSQEGRAEELWTQCRLSLSDTENSSAVVLTANLLVADLLLTSQKCRVVGLESRRIRYIKISASSSVNAIASSADSKDLDSSPTTNHRQIRAVKEGITSSVNRPYYVVEPHWNGVSTYHGFA